MGGDWDGSLLNCELLQSNGRVVETCSYNSSRVLNVENGVPLPCVMHQYCPRCPEKYSPFFLTKKLVRNTSHRSFGNFGSLPCLRPHFLTEKKKDPTITINTS